MTFDDICVLALCALGFYIGGCIGKYVVLPFLIRKTTKEIDKNPKWITSALHSKYYGFSDIDFITAESTIGALPRFRVAKGDNTRLELLIPNDTLTKDVEKIGQIALVGKIKVKYGLFFPDKPLYWLSILCFMLDGGEVAMKEVEKRQETN